MITKAQSTTSIPKRQKPIEETQMEIQTLEDDHIDRISELPNSILCHILSFLPTKFAVGTSILSTRWKNIFASIPNHNLVFDDTLVLYPKHQSKSISSASRTSFVDFVYGVLTIILRDVLDHKNILPDVSYVNSFSLNCKQDHGHLHINAWINALAWANVEELFLRITLKNSNLLHSSLFGCTSVVKLSLGWNVLLEVPDSVYFPNLKFLSLDYVKFIDGDSSYRFINGCPVLEELCIDNCEWGDMEVLIILAPSLKRLYLENCFSDSDYEILLDTPALEYFFCYDYLADSYMVNDMSSLVEAHLDVGLSEEQLDEEEDLSLYSQKVAILVTACSNVEYLYLSGAAIEAIHYSSCAMPTFHKLSQLKLGGMDFHGWKLLPHILERSPNLQVLVFTRGFFVFKDCYHIFKNHLLENVPVCVSLHLQEIRFVEFKGEDDELRLVEYFLDNSKVLKKLEISTYMSLERHSSISKKILMLPKCSKTCQIVLS